MDRKKLPAQDKPKQEKSCLHTENILVTVVQDKKNVSRKRKHYNYFRKQVCNKKQGTVWRLRFSGHYSINKAISRQIKPPRNRNG